MRTTLLSLLFIFYGLNSHAQIVYTPFIPQENPPLLLETPRASPQPTKSSQYRYQFIVFLKYRINLKYKKK